MATLPIMRFVFDRRHRASATKEGSVELQVYYMGERKWLSTGVRVLPKQWKNGQVVARIDSGRLNQLLRHVMDVAQTIVDDMLQGGGIRLSDMPERMRLALHPEEEQKEPQLSFMQFCEERAEIRKYGKSADSQERYDRFMRWFRAWGGIIEFDDVTELKVIDMDRALTATGMKNYSKWNNYHRFLNSFIIDAVDEGLIKRNPYKHVQIEKDKSSGGLGKYLEPGEFRRIERLKLPTKSLEQVRDVFVFQTYTCLSYTDLAAFDASLLREVNGRQVYVARRGKTKQQFVFLLLEPARRLLEKYNHRLPVISNVKYNQYLKALAQFAGIEKPLSSHWARHTGATLLLNQEVNMEVVAKVLGHSSTKITREVYAKMLDETVVDALSRVERGLCANGM